MNIKTIKRISGAREVEPEVDWSHDSSAQRHRHHRQGNALCAEIGPFSTKIADKNWVLTAYDEKAADDKHSAIVTVNQAQAAQGTNLSDRKGTKSDTNPQQLICLLVEIMRNNHENLLLETTSGHCLGMEGRL